MSDPAAIFSPGVIVRHPTRADWGEGQVQSCIGSRITVNFREAGKVVVDANEVNLILVSF